MTFGANKRVQGTRHKVSGPLTRDVGPKHEYEAKLQTDNHLNPFLTLRWPSGLHYRECPSP